MAERLERRLLLASVSVSTLADASNGDTSSIANLIANPGADGISLREAITAANNTAGTDTINFSVSGTINVLSALPTLSTPMSIVASTSGTPTIELKGAAAGTGASGILITGDHCTVRGLVINSFNFPNILISGGGGNNTIAGCYIGTDFAGTDAPLNPNSGIFIENSSSNVIGGFTPQDRNVISGNGVDGVHVFNSPFTKIRGNYIGTNAAGTAPAANARFGVALDRTSDCTVGGDDADDGAVDGSVGARNVISGNINSSGVGVFGNIARRNIIRGNYIGTNAAGTAAIPNRFGVIITSSSDDGLPASETTVGGTTPGAGNLISGNDRLGIRLFDGTFDNVIQANFIGTKANGVDPLPNGTGALPAETNFGFGINFSGSSSSISPHNNTIGGDDDDDGSLDGNVLARNIISGNAKGGIKFTFGTANAVQGNYIGLKFDGSAELPNSGAGVQVESSGNLIGGAADGAGNTISGNTTSGILIQSGATNNNIFGNRIGTNPAGLAAIGNDGGGVRIVDSPGNFVGGPTTALGFFQGNLISGNNASPGVSLEGSGTTGNGVYGNLIGTNIIGTASLPNGGDGVAIDDGASNNFVGAADQPGGQARNVISGNFQNGVRVGGSTSIGNQILANRIGTSISGLLQVANTAAGVAIFNAADTIVSGDLISGNGTYGVYITGAPATGNVVQQSIIGLKSNGNEALKNFFGGVFIENAQLNTIGGNGVGNTISGNLNDGILIQGSTAGGNKVQGNIIGLNNDGDAEVGNSSGITISDAPNNLIGGDTPLAGTGLGNVISGNTLWGVLLTGSGAGQNEVQGNIIGLNLDGDAPINNFDGVEIKNAPGNTIGGATSSPGSGVGNVISGNNNDGVTVSGFDSIGNKIQGNLIGVARDGTTGRGNRENGIEIEADNTKVGGTSAGLGNVIAFNGTPTGAGGRGVAVASGTGNSINQNRIYSNIRWGIDLGGSELHFNDPDDADVGPNNFQNIPVVRSVTKNASQHFITFQLFTNPSASPRDFTWEFFSNLSNELNPSGYGDGEEFIGSQVVTVDVDGFAQVTRAFTNGQSNISATVTDPDGNTSGFSMIDTDADGLADVWEDRGFVDLNLDGTKELLLPGASPFNKDIFVEVDAMELVRPDPAALNDVVLAFANAPADLVNNPDDSPGITLHVLLSELTLPTDPWDDLYPAGDPKAGEPRGFDLLKNGDPNGDGSDGHFGAPAERASANWPLIRTARLLTTRYCVFAWSFGKKGNGGLGEFLGNDFMVTLGSWPTSGGTHDQQAAAFMHELGHNLGLRHGGGDELNYKPNYFSVMNYLWSVGPRTGYGSSWKLDYSRVELDSVNELHIDETKFIGFGGTPGFVEPVGPIYDVVNMKRQKPLLVPQFGPIDLDGGGPTNTSVTRDLNFQNDTNGDGVIDDRDSSFETLNGYNDWANLNLTYNTALRTFDDDATVDDFLLLDSIGDGPGVIQFSHDQYDSEERSGSATVTVVRAGGTDGAVSVQYRTIPGGSATPGVDFTSTTGTLSFADGEYIKTFTIPLIDDLVNEGTETVQLELFDPAGAALGSRTTATLGITEPMVAKFANPVLSASESGGTLPIDVVLSGETGQTLSEEIRVSLLDLLSGTAVAGVDYALPANTELTFPAGSAVGAKQTITLTLIDNFSSDAARTINLALSPIDSFAAVPDPAALTVTLVNGAILNDFDTPANYTDQFREVRDGEFMGPNNNGYITYNNGGAGTQGGTALYDTTPLDSTTTVDLFGGGTSREVYSLDLRAIGGRGGSGAGIYARVPGSSVGGYHLSLRVTSHDEELDIWKNPSLLDPGATDVILFQAPAANFANLDDWYTLVFTLQTNAAGTAVSLSGQVFRQGHTTGAPLAQVSGVDSTAPVVTPGQIGFRLFDQSGGSDVDMDNFTADVTLMVNAGDNVTLDTSHYLTALIANGNATLAADGNKVIVTREVAVTGRLDLTDHAMVIKTTPIGSWNGAAYTGVTGLIQSGRNGGNWTGNGIVTSSATGNFTTLAVARASDLFGAATGLFAGQAVTGNDVLVKYTYGGDANLDGKINVDDYGRIDFNVPLGTTGWFNGDFNYDGKINVDDYGIIDFNVGIQGPPLSGASTANRPRPTIPITETADNALPPPQKQTPDAKRDRPIDDLFSPDNTIL